MEIVNQNIAQAVLVHIDVNEENQSMALALPQKWIDKGVKPGDLVTQNLHFVDLYKEIKQTKQMMNVRGIKIDKASFVPQSYIRTGLFRV